MTVGWEWEKEMRLWNLMELFGFLLDLVGFCLCIGSVMSTGCELFSHTSASQPLLVKTVSVCVSALPAHACSLLILGDVKTSSVLTDSYSSGSETASQSCLSFTPSLAPTPPRLHLFPPFFVFHSQASQAFQLDRQSLAPTDACKRSWRHTQYVHCKSFTQQNWQVPEWWITWSVQCLKIGKTNSHHNILISRVVTAGCNHMYLNSELNVICGDFSQSSLQLSFFQPVKQV